jgi:hypothetical protein
MTKVTLALLLSVLTLCAVAPAAVAQPPCVVKSGMTTLLADGIVTKMYPSLTPRAFVYAPYGQFKAFQTADQRERFQLKPESPTTWSFNPSDRPSDDWSLRLTPTRVLDESEGRNVLLTFDPKAINYDKRYKLSAVATETTEPGTSQQVCLEYAGDVQLDKPSPFTWKIEPTIAPDAELADGTKTRAGRLGLGLEFPALFPNDFANIFFKFDAVLSTEPTDTEAKIEAEFGVQRSLLDSWYVPARASVKYVADEPFKNQSLVAIASVATLIPWGWNKSTGVFWNGVVKAPGSPLLGVSPQYQRVLRSDQGGADRNVLRLVGTFAWERIYVLPAVFGQKLGDGNPWLDIAATVWAFPDVRPNDTVRALEHRVDISLVLPSALLTKRLTPGKRELLARVAEDGADAAGPFRVVLKFSTGANEATGFRRSNDFAVKLQYGQ